MNQRTKYFHSGRHVFFLLVFISIVIAAAVLKIASTVILPITIAILLAFVMFPLVLGLDKIRCPRILSILLVVVIIVAGMYLFGMVLFTSGKMIVEQLPEKYGPRFQEVYKWIADLFELPNDDDLSFWQNLWGQEGIRNFVRDFTITFSNNSVKFASSAVIIVLFVVFILLEASIFKEKITAAFEDRLNRIDSMGNEIISKISRYLTAKFFISLANGIIFAVAFHFIGLEFAIVWGIIQFLLNFIPTLGSIAAGTGISLFALVQFWPEPGPVILIVAIILFVNMLCNVLDPKIIGDNVGISPLVILVSLSIWGYIWGFAGMLIAVPMTVIIKIVCENIPIMEPVSILLGSRKSVRAREALLQETKKTENEKAET